MTKYFRLLPFPEGEDKFNEFKEKGFVSIGWWELLSVKKLTREQIKERYMETYPTSTVHASRLVASYFIKLQEMTPGDVILIPYSGEYHFFEVEGKYFFDNEEQDIALKQRIKVKFIKKLNKNSFSTKFRKSIGVQPTLTYLGEYKDEIESVLLGDDPISLSKQKAFVYTESSGSISLSYSDNISKKILKEFFDKVQDEI